MNKNLKVLILYAKYGEGHLQVSRVLQEQFAVEGITDVILEDLFADAHPVIDGLTRYIYGQSFSGASFLYGWSYYLTQNMGHDTQLSKWFNAFGIKKLQEIIESEQPDMVINTFPMLVMPELIERTGANIPVFTIMTDFDLHGRWLHSKIDKYYVATEDLKTKMVNRGIPPKKIMASGIPIRQAFEEPQDAESVYRKYGLDPSNKIILLMARTYGMFRGVKETCLSLAKDPGLQIILVCGKNERLRQEMKRVFSDLSTLRILGFTEDIPALMSVASCIVTKPGGITISEALRSNLPIYLFRPVPGQERENARYLRDKGAAQIVEGGEELTKGIRDVLYNEQSMTKIRQAALSLRKPRAAKSVVDDLLKETSMLKKARAQTYFS